MTEVIVILGAAVWPKETPSPTLLRRVNCAAQLWHKSGGMIIASGGLGKHPPSEAEMMRRLLVDRNVPEAAILLEGQSTSTLTNARYSLAIIRERELGPVIIVTDSYHRARAWITFRSLGASVKTISASYAEPKPRLWLRIKYTLRELIALPVYTARLFFSKS